jgi:hypothetical protein
VRRLPKPAGLVTVQLNENELARFKQWRVDIEEAGEDPRWTIAGSHFADVSGEIASPVVDAARGLGPNDRFRLACWGCVSGSGNDHS